MNKKCIKLAFGALLCTASVVALSSDYYWRTPMTSTGDILLQFKDVNGIQPYDMGPGVGFYNNTSWSVNDMTAADLPNLSSVQASVDPAAYGSTSVQWYGDKFSAWLHTWSVPPSSKPGVNYWSIAFGGAIPGDNRPWGTPFGSNARLCSAYFQKVNKLYVQGNIALYNYTGVWLEDAATGGRINMVVQVWDSRAGLHFFESLATDVQVGAYVSSYIGGNRYTTIMPNSQTAHSGVERPEEWYGFCVSRENLTNMINDRNNKDQATPGFVPLSSNPANYRLLGLTLQPEAGNITEPGAAGHVGITMRENWVFTRY